MKRFIFFICLFFSVLYSDEYLSTPPSNLPVKVETSFYLLNFTSINEKDETFLADVYFSFRWNDPRLAYPPVEGHAFKIYLEEAAKDRLYDIWWPQIEFINGLIPVYSNRSLFIFPDGTVEYHISINCNFFTPLNFKRFPFDQQKLLIKIDSFMWNKNILEFIPIAHANLYNPETVNPYEEAIIKVEQYTETISGVGISHFHGGGDYSTFISAITVERKSSFFLYEVFIPLFLVISISCSVFFGYKEPFLDKIMVNLTAFLVLMAGKFTINVDLPHIGYLTMIDKAFLTAYLCIGLTVLSDVLEKVTRETNEARASRINQFGRWTIFLIFIITLLLIYLLS